MTCRSRVICKTVASRSGTIGAQAKIEVVPPRPKKGAKCFFVALHFRFVCGLYCSMMRRVLQMTQLLQITKITQNNFVSATSNRYHSTSFVKTSAPGRFPSSGTAVLTDFLKKTPQKHQMISTTSNFIDITDLILINSAKLLLPWGGFPPSGTLA